MKRLNCVYMFCILLACFSFIGCSFGSAGKEREKGEYDLYYLGADAVSLKSNRVMLTETDPVKIAQTLFEKLKVSPNKKLLSPFLEKINVKAFSKNDKTLIIDFDRSFYSLALEPEQELLMCAALTKTFSQIEGVESATLLCEGEAITGKTGLTYENLVPEKFILGQKDETQKQRVVLYFADQTGQKLIEETRELVLQKNVSLEQAIIAAILEGPKTEGRYPVFSKNIDLPKVWIIDGICYVNFSKDFLKNQVKVKDQLPLYAIVNSLSELNGVTKIQFLIEGSSDWKFRDSISLKEPFERNLDIVIEIGG